MIRIVYRGEVYWADLDGKAKGSEQKGIRPVLIIQNDIGNMHSPTTIIACITSQINKAKLPTHEELSDIVNDPSVILLEQIRTIDKSRLSDYIGKLSNSQMKSVESKLLISLGIGMEG